MGKGPPRGEGDWKNNQGLHCMDPVCLGPSLYRTLRRPVTIHETASVNSFTVLWIIPSNTHSQFQAEILAAEEGLEYFLWGGHPRTRP